MPRGTMEVILLNELTPNTMTRFFSKIKTITENNCIEWGGSKNNKGYGIFSIKGKSVAAHRIFYMYYNNVYLIDLQLHHVCKNTICINPNHLIPVTPLEHAKTMNRENTGKNNQHKDKTHCKNGHEYTEENTYKYNNKRSCRICNRERRFYHYWGLR